MSVCMEVQGAPEGRASRAITFRSLLTKGAQAEARLYNATLHLCQRCAEQERPGATPTSVGTAGETASGWLLGLKKGNSKQNRGT